MVPPQVDTGFIINLPFWAPYGLKCMIFMYMNHYLNKQKCTFCLFLQNWKLILLLKMSLIAHPNLKKGLRNFWHTCWKREERLRGSGEIWGWHFLRRVGGKNLKFTIFLVPKFVLMQQYMNHLCIHWKFTNWSSMIILEYFFARMTRFYLYIYILPFDYRGTGILLNWEKRVALFRLFRVNTFRIIQHIENCIAQVTPC